MKYLVKAQKVIQEFNKCNIEQIPRNENSNANALSRLAVTYLSQMDRTIYFEMKEVLSIAEVEEVMQLNGRVSWMTPISKYLLGGEKP